MRKPCCDKQEMNKGAWSKQEDQKLIDYINKHGEGCWRTLPQAAGLLRCGKSCRLRWINYLRPDLKRGNFAEDEEDLIIKLHALLGNRWSLIAGRLPGRTDNEVKNYWNSHLRRKLMNMGVDPNNHRLSGKFPSLHNHHQNQTMSGTSITSSGLKHNINNNVLISKKKDNDLNDEPAKADHDDHQVGVFGEINNYEQVVSDAASGLEDESYGGCCLPDLNLDLTISIPNSSSLSKPNTDNSATHHHGEENNQNPILHHHHHHHHEYSKSSSRDQIHFASSPTLVLFQ